MIITSRLFAVLILILLVPSFLFSAVLSVEECIYKALGNNPDLQIIKKRIAISEERRMQSKSFNYPNVSVNGSYNHLSESPPQINLSYLAASAGTTDQRIAGNPLLQYAFQDNYTANFKVNQPIYSGGKNRGGFGVSEAEYEVKKAELKIVRDRVKVEVIKSYFGVVVARAMLDLANEATEQLKQHLEIVENIMKSGRATEYEHLKTEVQLLSWAPKIAQAERELNNSRRRLKLVMGTNVNDEISVGSEWELKYVPYEDNVTVEKAREAALKNRPEIVMLKALKKSNSKTKEIVNSKKLPYLNLQYNYNFLNEKYYLNVNGDSWKKWWDIRLVAFWEVFTYGRTTSELKANDLQTEIYDIELASLIDRISSEVDDVFDYRYESKKVVELWRKNIELASRGYMIAREKYKNGKITNLDVLESQVALIDARVQFLKALYEYKVAAAEFKRIIPLN